MVFNDNFGSSMAQEIAEAPGTFRDCIRADCVADNVIDRLRNAAAFYTVARGSSDAVATILAYEFMRELRCPTTSLPPSIFSLNDGLHLEGAGVLVISQSGASEDLVLSAPAAIQPPMAPSKPVFAMVSGSMFKSAPTHQPKLWSAMWPPMASRIAQFL